MADHSPLATLAPPRRGLVSGFSPPLTDLTCSLSLSLPSRVNSPPLCHETTINRHICSRPLAPAIFPFSSNHHSDKSLPPSCSILSENTTERSQEEKRKLECFFYGFRQRIDGLKLQVTLPTTVE